jgi:hypothetical protein
VVRVNFILSDQRNFELASQSCGAFSVKSALPHHGLIDLPVKIEIDGAARRSLT